ncbi:17395_t:CDS:2 [Funneliformis geosporum]|uniref:17395_t:CDS:1 n=1 Tax=Funneliformis geosporum TaxID=1117311 RepID=A0A9W4SC35_9GLOM|nr:17395_t:CDS:2 [Funneliformis geosporum]
MDTIQALAIIVIRTILINPFKMGIRKYMDQPIQDGSPKLMVPNPFKSGTRPSWSFRLPIEKSNLRVVNNLFLQGSEELRFRALTFVRLRILDGSKLVSIHK